MRSARSEIDLTSPSFAEVALLVFSAKIRSEFPSFLKDAPRVSPTILDAAAVFPAAFETPSIASLVSSSLSPVIAAVRL